MTLDATVSHALLVERTESVDRETKARKLNDERMVALDQCSWEVMKEQLASKDLAMSQMMAGLGTVKRKRTDSPEANGPTPTAQNLATGIRLLLQSNGNLAQTKHGLKKLMKFARTDEQTEELQDIYFIILSSDPSTGPVRQSALQLCVSPFSSSLRGYSRHRHSVFGPYHIQTIVWVVVPHPILGRYSNRVNFSCF